jgi:hypothetical protein
MLTDEKVKQIFFYVKSNDPEGVYADDVDILEYARKIEAYVRIEAMREEREECVKLVKSLNVEVAKALEDYRKCAERNFT